MIDLNDLLVEVANWADQFPCIKRVYVFGSVVRRDATSGSDLDLAIEYVEEVLQSERSAVECFTRVNADWKIFSERLRRRFHYPPKVTGLFFADGYDSTAWAAIRSGREIDGIRKATAIWTIPKSDEKDCL